MRLMRMACWTLLACFSLGNTHAAGTDSPSEIADALHAAIGAGDEAALRELLDPELTVYESGAVESSLEEYASHHMRADIMFMAQMQREVLSRDVVRDGSLSVVTTRSRLHGTFQGRDMNKASNETLVIRHGETGSRIVHIHWSSMDMR